VLWEVGFVWEVGESGWCRYGGCQSVLEHWGWRWNRDGRMGESDADAAAAAVGLMSSGR